MFLLWFCYELVGTFRIRDVLSLYGDLTFVLKIIFDVPFYRALKFLLWFVNLGHFGPHFTKVLTFFRSNINLLNDLQSVLISSAFIALGD